MNKLEQLEKENQALKAKVMQLENLNKYYEEQLKLNRAKKFGASSEQYDYEQMSFFNEAEQVVSENPIIAEPTEETIIKKKKKQKRGANLGNLEVERIEYKLDDTTCPECGEELHVMTKEIRKELKIIPAQVKIIEHVKYIYSCRNCENTGTKATILKAATPTALIPKSFASPSVLAHIMNQKYANAMPLDRQEKEFKRQGVILPRQNLSNWVIKGANLLKPLRDLLKEELLKNEVLHADETTLEVLHEPGKEPQSKSYMWLYRTSVDCEKPVVLYDYTEGRTGKFAKEYLKDFKGYLHTDGYAGYRQLEPEIILCGCYAHLRRKFIEAFNILKDDKKAESLENQALILINQLFKIEEEIKDKSAEEKKKIRAEKSKLIVEQFYEFVSGSQTKTLPQSLLGKAFTYAQNQKKYLLTFLSDGRIELSNNRAERSIKPFVIGRKNWLFSNTPKGAHSSAIIYSIIQTAIENKLKPQAYLEWVFEQIGLETNPSDPTLLPWSDKIPENIKLK